MALLPPRVIGPLSECSTGVKVEGQLTGAQVDVFADGAPVASGTATGPSQVFTLSTSLAAGANVTATQTIGADTSDPSPEPVAVQQKPPTIGPVGFRTSLHVCGECLWLEGLVPGAKVEITGNGGLRGSGESYDGNARVGLNAPIDAGEILVAQQEACGEPGVPSPGPPPDFPGGSPEQGQRLPPPTVQSPLRACQKGVTVSDVYPGARVTLLRSGGPNLQACFDLSALRFGVNPGLVEGETVSARQEFLNCEIFSEDAAPVIVGPAEPVPPPIVHEPICTGATSIRLSNIFYGSRIRIFYEGGEIGTAESPEEGTYDFPVPPIPPPTHHGGFITAQQELCGIWSEHSERVTVNPAPEELPKPKVSEPLFACAAAVHVSNLHPGVRVYVISAMLGAPIGDILVFTDEALVPVAPLLMAGDEITAMQIGCGLQSSESDAVLVQELTQLEPPIIETPLYSCQSSVTVLNTVPGSRVDVYVNGAYRGSAIAGPEKAEVPVIGELEVGDLVQARQRLCDQISELGPEVRVERFDGRWLQIGDEGKAEILAVHAALLHTNKIVYFGGDQHTASLNANGDVDHTRLFDCASYNVSSVTGLPASADLFCAGHAQLPDGRIIVGGGTHAWSLEPGEDPHGHDPSGHFIGSRESWLFDPADHQWHQAGPLVTQRASDPARDASLDIERTGGKWYPTLITLSDGKVLAVSGHPREFDTRHNNDTLEWFDADSESWDYVGTVDSNRIPRSVGRTLEYPRLFVLPNGDVLSVTSLSGGDLWIWHTGNDPNDWTHLTSPRPGYGGNPLNHTAVLLPLKPDEEYNARVLMCGESTAWVLDPMGAPTWEATARVLSGHPDPGDMNPRRANLDAVILPTGEVFVEGGVKNIFSDATGVKKAEMFDPENTSGSPVGTWRVLPEAQEVRNYHSVALLMPNGAVWVAGSNFNSGTGLGNRNLWIEIFEPWYFCYPRPRIHEAPDRVCVGDEFAIRTPDADKIERVVLVRCGTCTHNFNPDQRVIELEFEYSPADRLVVIAPPNTNIAPPGYYLLFVLNGARVPSIGRFVQICPSTSRGTIIWPPWWEIIFRRLLDRLALEPVVTERLIELLGQPAAVSSSEEGRESGQADFDQILTRFGKLESEVEELAVEMRRLEKRIHNQSGKRKKKGD